MSLEHADPAAAEARAAVTADAVLDAALTLFAERGYHGTAVSQYTRGGTYTPNQGAAVNQYARTNTSMPPASAGAAPRQAAPVRTVSASGGGRNYGSGSRH